MDSENQYILYPNFGTSFYDPEGEKTTRKISMGNVSRKAVGKNVEEVTDFWKNLNPGAEVALGSPDIIHANNYSCPKGIKRAKVVYTLYDLNFGSWYKPDD